MITLLARRALIGLLVFGAVSAVAGGVLGVALNGAGVPLDYLQGTPFSSYVIPGLILGVAVGGTQSVAAIAVWRTAPWGMAAASVAGFGMIIWIFVELAILTEYSFLQSIYFAVGLVELLLVLRMSGALGPFPQPGRRPRATGGTR